MTFSEPTNRSPWSRIKNLCLVLTLVAALPYSGRTQSDSVFHFLRSVKGNFTGFNVDNLDNIYLINIGDQLKKIDARGDSAGVFNDVKRYGKPGYIDVTNPMKVLLFYPPFSTVVVLDRFLNMRNTINFRKQGIFTVQSIATSYDNNIWLFDEQEYKLKKIDEDGKVIQESTDFRLLFDSVPSPSQLIDRDNFIYLYDKARGFYIFDYYGGFKNRLLFPDWNNVAVSGKTIYGFNQSTLFSYELNSLTLKEYRLPPFFGHYSAIKAMNRKVYLLKEDGLDIYEVK
ncbi:MAG: hypothetical protein IPI66_02060 [Chitinophagaceae bacterium]|nr:hypothetical protein [Chitinophagaceae bacterium]